MTRKDYVRIASALNSAWKAWPSTNDGDRMLSEVTAKLANALWEDNNKFDVNAFVKACVKE